MNEVDEKCMLPTEFKQLFSALRFDRSIGGKLFQINIGNQRCLVTC